VLADVGGSLSFLLVLLLVLLPKLHRCHRAMRFPVEEPNDQKQEPKWLLLLTVRAVAVAGASTGWPRV
jgi:hypothetical protein